MTKESPSTARSWFGNLFADKSQVAAEPAAVAAALPEAEADAPAEEVNTICYCFDVDETAIRFAIKSKRLNTVEEVGLCLNAGTHCGSCINRIEALFDQPGVKSRIADASLKFAE
ncbi:MAG: (2Fe-2S)-binding protein [Methylomonas sp.]|jgi:assimilatory nitrate reductase catalytic subunit